MSCLIFEPFFVKEGSTAEEEKELKNPVRDRVEHLLLRHFFLRSILAFETELLRLLEETKEDEEEGRRRRPFVVHRGIRFGLQQRGLPFKGFFFNSDHPKDLGRN